MKLNWQDRFKEMNSDELFIIFSETNRLNIDPQIFAGNLLFERNYNLEKLKNTKLTLINSINESFDKKHQTDPKKVKQEYIITTVFKRIFFTFFIISSYFIYRDKINPDFSTGFNILFIILLLGNFIPLVISIRNGMERAIKHIERNMEKKNKLIDKIEMGLKF